MASLRNLIARIRRRVQDSDLKSENRPLYADIFYSDAVDRGLAELNLDLEVSYTLATIPAAQDFLLELRATIEMCYIRAAEGGSTLVSDFPESPIQTLSVPNLSVNKFGTPAEGPKFWRNLCDVLEGQYQRLLKKLGVDDDVSGSVKQAVMLRTSMRTGGRRPYAYDTSFTALAATVAESGGVVSLAWAATLDERFARYDINRSADSEMADPERIAVISDNHTVTYDDESPGTGTWYYTVTIVNNNNLSQASDILLIVVP
jgi:hypothetical protein